MHIDFADTNPQTRNNSLLLRFDTGEPTSPCLLVDAGPGVNPRHQLGADDELYAILLTHLHNDHLSSLSQVASNQIPIFTSQLNIDLLQNVFGDTDLLGNSGHHARNPLDISTLDFRPIDAESEQLFPGVSLRGVSAGHVPGATAFFLSVSDRGEERSILVTGDCSFNPVGGWPELQQTFPDPVDILVVNAHERTDADDQFEEALEWVLGEVVRRQEVYLAGGSLHLLEYLFALDTVFGQVDTGVEIVVLGRLAKVYDELTPSLPLVTSVQETDAPAAELGQRRIVMGGPERFDTPRTVSKTILEARRNDPNVSIGRLVADQRQGSAPSTSLDATYATFASPEHPPLDEIQKFVERLRPGQVVVKHGGNELKDEFLFAFSWATNSDQWYRLYDSKRGFTPPPWVSDGLATNIQNNIAPSDGVGHDPRTEFQHPAYPSEPLPSRLSLEFLSYLETALDPLERDSESADKPATAESDKRRIGATVVDGADGVQFLQLERPLDLEHGQRLTISPDDIEARTSE